MAGRYRGGGGLSLKPENSLKRAEELIGVSADCRAGGLAGGYRVLGACVLL